MRCPTPQLEGPHGRGVVSTPPEACRKVEQWAGAAEVIDFTRNDVAVPVQEVLSCDQFATEPARVHRYASP
jgi:hypothetical protein